MSKSKLAAPSKPAVLSTGSYRGHRIEVQQHPECKCLVIDGVEFMLEEDDDGVLSHEYMYQKFATPYELAEALIKQWGNIPAKTFAQTHSGHGGGHGGGHGPGQGGHDHKH